MAAHLRLVPALKVEDLPRNIPPVEDCPFCHLLIRRFPTIRGRVQVVDASSSSKGNIRWLPRDRQAVQLRKEAAQLARAEDVPLFLFHGIHCPPTRYASESTVQQRRREEQQRAPIASDETRQQAMALIRQALARKQA